MEVESTMLLAFSLDKRWTVVFLRANIAFPNRRSRCLSLKALSSAQQCLLCSL